MRFRALAVALMFPLGLLAACGGGDDSGLTTRDGDSSDATADESSATTGENSDASVDLDDDEAVRQAAIDIFVAQGLTEEDATCLIDEIGIDQIIDIGLSSGGSVEDIDPDSMGVLVEAVVACDIDPTQLG